MDIIKNVLNLIYSFIPCCNPEKDVVKSPVTRKTNQVAASVRRQTPSKYQRQTPKVTKNLSFSPSKKTPHDVANRVLGKPLKTTQAKVRPEGASSSSGSPIVLTEELLENGFVLQELEKRHPNSFYNYIFDTDREEYNDFYKVKNLINREYTNMPDSVFNNSKICISLVVGNCSHYVSLFIDRDQKKVMYYNPLSDRKPIFVNYFYNAFLELECERHPETEREKWELDTNTKFPQTDGWSCGQRSLHFFNQAMHGLTMAQIDDNPPRPGHINLATQDYLRWKDAENSRKPVIT